MSELLAQVQTSVETYFDQAQYLMDKNLVPKSYSKPEHIVMAISYGSQLGLDPVTSLNSIDIIENRIAIQARIIPGLLAKHGIAIEVIKDFEPVYERKPLVVKGEDGKPVVTPEGNMTYYRDENGDVMYKETEVDRITTLRFKRYFPNIGVTSSEISFRLSDAKKAGWMSKQNWNKLPSFMCMARCISRGARLFGSDVIAGLYDNYEVAEFTDTEFDVDSEGTIIIEKKSE
jgi:hypothetical protein